MMTGEVDYSDVFYGDDEGDIEFKAFLKILYLIFVITVVLLLHNLLIGITVSDVQVCLRTHNKMYDATKIFLKKLININRIGL